MSNEEFQKVVKATIQSLPKEFLSQLDNIEIIIEDEPPHHAPLLGLYRGIPKTNRLSYSSLPDTITLYKNPLLRISVDKDHAKENIRNTILHEIGHHFGLSDAELYKIKKIS